MLKLLPPLPRRAVEDAVDMASSCFDVEDDDRDFGVSDAPIAIYVPPSPSANAVHPSDLIPNGFALIVLGGGLGNGADDDETKLIGWITLGETRRRLRAVAFEFVDAGSDEQRALKLADTSAERLGEREIRMVDIPWLHARFFWVTGDDPQFVDRMDPKVYDEAGFVAEMARRWAVTRPSSVRD